MRKLFTLILLAAAFVGGYHLGRQPDSPDIIAWGKDACVQAADVTKQVISLAKDRSDGKSGPMRVQVGHKTYTVSSADMGPGDNDHPAPTY